MSGYIELPPAAGGGGGGAPSGPAGGALTGTYPNPGLGTITSVNSVAMPAGGALAPGAVLRATGAGTAAYGTVDPTDTDAFAIASEARGDLMFRGAAGWARLAAGTAGLALLTAGAGADPAWGAITSVNSVAMPAGGALAPGAVLRATAAGTAAYGTLDPTNVAAFAIASEARGDLFVRGASAWGRLAKGTTGQVLAQGANDPAWAALDPTVAASFAAASEARGDILYRGASAWARLGAGTAGQALISGGAGADPSWSTNFGANALVTTSTISLGATPATTGSVRLSNNTGLYFRNAANSADQLGIFLDASNGLFLGGTPASITFGTSVGTTIVLSSTGFNFNGTQSASVTRLSQTTAATNATVANLTVQAQSAGGASSSNLSGGALLLQGGDRTSTSGRRTGIRASIAASDAPLLELCDVQAAATSASRVLAFGRGAAITSTDWPTGCADIGYFFANAATVPTVAPGNTGFALYATGGLPYAWTNAGHNQSILPTYATKVWPSDADYVALQAEWAATEIELTGGSLTAPRNFIVPLKGRWVVFNNTSGGQAITVKGASGTGISIATGKTAVVYGNGTNIARASADV